MNTHVGKHTIITYTSYEQQQQNTLSCKKWPPSAKKCSSVHEGCMCIIRHTLHRVTKPGFDPAVQASATDLNTFKPPLNKNNLARRHWALVESSTQRLHWRVKLEVGDLWSDMLKHVDVNWCCKQVNRPSIQHSTDQGLQAGLFYRVIWNKPKEHWTGHNDNCVGNN